MSPWCGEGTTETESVRFPPPTQGGAGLKSDQFCLRSDVSLLLLHSSVMEGYVSNRDPNFYNNSVERG